MYNFLHLTDEYLWDKVEHKIKIQACIGSVRAVVNIINGLVFMCHFCSSLHLMIIVKGYETTHTISTGRDSGNGWK